MPLPCRFASDISRPRHSTAGTRRAQVRFLPTTTRSLTIGRSGFSGYTPNFTKDKALSEDGRGTEWHVWISLTSSQLVKKFPASYATKIFKTLKTARHASQSWARYNQSSSSYLLIILSIILPSTQRFFKFSLFLRPFLQNLLCTSVGK